jgi:hypothetical protein
MTQLTLDSFPRHDERGSGASSSNQQALQETSVLVLILKDFSVAWVDRDWYLHEQDLVYLDVKLASLLIGRGIARKTEVP